MSESIFGEGRVALMERKRRQLLSSGVIGFALWQGLDLVGDIKTLDFHVKTLVLGLSLVAWAIWFFSLIQLLRFGKQMSKEPGVARALSDERWAQNRLNAFAIGFIAVMVAQAGLLLLSQLVSLEATVASRITILVGVTAFITAFLRYDKE